jgi:pimeloyl-ACP methyl ester carboxylesterase
MKLKMKMKMNKIRDTVFFFFKRSSLLGAIWIFTLCGCATTKAPLPDSRHLITTNGAPTLVFQAGLGDDSRTWKDILPELTAQYRVFIVDRPGTGLSRNVKGSRDPCTIAKEQHDMLKSEGIAPPYLLVGHSLGGLYQYAFLGLYPDEVAGFVLIDPTHPRNWQALQQQFPKSASMLKGMNKVAFSSMQAREFDDQTVCLDRPEFAQVPQKPGIILIAGRSRSSDPEDYETFHLSLAQEWPALMGIHKVDMAWDSAHYIHQEHPKRVIAAIRQIASPKDCPTGCIKPEQRLDQVKIGGTKAFDIVYGKTNKNAIEVMVGAPIEDCITPFDQLGSVCIYRTKPKAAPALLSLVPIVGDIIDATEMAVNLKEWRELVVEYDEYNLVRHAGIRVLE